LKSNTNKKKAEMVNRLSDIIGTNWTLRDLFILIYKYHDCGIFKRLPEMICRRHAFIKNIIHKDKSEEELLLYYLDKVNYSALTKEHVKVNKLCSELSISRDQFYYQYRYHLMTALYSEILLRPIPGFYPEIYSEFNNRKLTDSFIDYLHRDFPEGIWKPIILKTCDKTDFKECNLKTALHVHLHYTEDLDEILERIQTSQKKPDLFFSVTSDESLKIVKEKTKNLSKYQIRIQKFPNSGRNVGPLFTGFSDDLGSYDVIGHVHGKKSPHVKERKFLKSWKKFIFDNVLGGNVPMIDYIINEFYTDRLTGIVFPDDPIVYGWGINKQKAVLVLEKANISLECTIHDHIYFPIGMMFWARRQALQPLFDLNLSWDDYPPEPVDTDGTLLHAIERILPIVSTCSGYTTKVTTQSFFDRSIP